MSKTTVSAIQMDVICKNQEENLSRALSLIENAADKGAEIICLPELFTTGFDYSYINQCTAPIYNQITAAVAEKAKQFGVFVIAGSLPITADGFVYNSAILFDAQGMIAGSYNKVHLFPPMDEDKYFTPGDEIAVFNTSLAKIGIMVCYDLRFPEITRKLAVAGAEIIFVPSEFPEPRINHWKILLQARAIENQLYVVGTNRVGNDSSNSFFGHSCVIDPWGNVIAEGDNTESIVIAEVDLSRVHEVRAQIPCLNNIRKDIY